MKMGKLGAEVSEKMKCAIRAKLAELGVHIDNELPDYVMVLVANKKTQQQMDEDLTLFLGDSTNIFTTWLYGVLKKLEQYTISSKGMKRKMEEKKVKCKKISTECDYNTFNKKVKLKSDNTPPRKCSDSIFENEDQSNSNETFELMTERTDSKEKTISEQQIKLIDYTDEEERMIIGDDDDAILLHDNNDEEGLITDRAENSNLKVNNIQESAQKYNFSDNNNSKEESNRPRERIKISWDDNDSLSKTKIINNNNKISCVNNKDSDNKPRDSNNRKDRNSKTCSVSSSEIKNSDLTNIIREKCDYSSKVLDARDIIKKKSGISSKISKKDGKFEKYRSRRSRDRVLKENKSRCQSMVSKPTIREPEKPSVPSMVKVTPRPVRLNSGIQPNCNLILRAVADAEKSIATTKLSQKKASNKNDYKDAELHNKISQRENISITLLNNRIISSSDIETSSKTNDSFVEEYDPTDPLIKEPGFPSTSFIKKVNDETDSASNNDCQPLSSIEEGCVDKSVISEPRFIITLDSTASDNELDGDFNITVENNKCDKTSIDDSLAVVRQPFDKSRLGPRLGPPVTADIPEVTRDYHLLTIDEGGNEPTSQSLDFEATELPTDAGKSQTRCKYWPCCEAGSSCPYYHPTTLCRLFPACHFGDKCLYIHPACKYADQCLNSNCPYIHTSATPAAAKATFKTPLPLSVPQNGQVCIYYPHCTKPFCPYIHIKKPCKFGNSCVKLGCEFEHPNRLLTKNPYKWVANQ